MHHYLWLPCAISYGTKYAYIPQWYPAGVAFLQRCNRKAIKKFRCFWIFVRSFIKEVLNEHPSTIMHVSTAFWCRNKENGAGKFIHFAAEANFMVNLSILFIRKSRVERRETIINYLATISCNLMIRGYFDLTIERNATWPLCWFEI